MSPTYNLQDISPVSRRVKQTGGVPKYRVVVDGPGTREVQLPGAANAGSIQGVTLDKCDNDANVAVQNAGDAICIAAGAIAKGAQVNVADNQGRVKTVSEGAGTDVNKVGVALEAAAALGDQVMVGLQIQRVRV